MVKNGLPRCQLVKTVHSPFEIMPINRRCFRFDEHSRRFLSSFWIASNLLQRPNKRCLQKFEHLVYSLINWRLCWISVDCCCEIWAQNFSMYMLLGLCVLHLIAASHRQDSGAFNLEGKRIISVVLPGHDTQSCEVLRSCFGFCHQVMKSFVPSFYVLQFRAKCGMPQ